MLVVILMSGIHTDSDLLIHSTRLLTGKTLTLPLKNEEISDFFLTFVTIYARIYD